MKLALCAMLLASQAHAATLTFDLIPAGHDVVGDCSGPQVPASGSRDLTAILLRESIEVHRWSVPGVAPLDTVRLTTPDLEPGDYSVWTRYRRAGVAGCDTTFAVTIAAPVDTVVGPYVALPFFADWAVFDSRQGRIMHPADLARALNLLYELTRPKP